MSKPPKNLTGKTNAQNVPPGKRKPFRKATALEVNERVEWLALTLAMQPGLKDSEVNKLMKERYNLEYRQTAEYLTRAKRLLSDRANITKEQAKRIGISKLLDTIQNGTKSESNAALRLWSDMFGLDAAKQFRLGDPDGKPMAPTVIAPQVHLIIPDNNRGEK